LERLCCFHCDTSNLPDLQAVVLICKDLLSSKVAGGCASVCHCNCSFFRRFHASKRPSVVSFLDCCSYVERWIPSVGACQNGNHVPSGLGIGYIPLYGCALVLVGIIQCNVYCFKIAPVKGDFFSITFVFVCFTFQFEIIFEQYRSLE
jgi:hypothetical protein